MAGADDFQYAITRNHQYEQFFAEWHYNGKVLNDDERRDFIKGNDDAISDYAEGLPMLKEGIESLKGKDDEFHNAYRTILLVYQFVVITSIDCLVISKYFLLADKDYDKRFMRGKMKVILNEGFKKLYGFNDETKKKSEWIKLSEIVECLPQSLQFEYQKITYLLDKHSKSSSWWKDERNVETHLDAEKLYESRCEEIEESKVMMDSVKLFSTLYSVQLFLTNVHACFHNYIVENYQQRNQVQK